jgi:hypothetical protein
MPQPQKANLQAPYFGPQAPAYPPLKHVGRVSGPFLAPNLARGFMQQWAPAGFRDREDVFLWEPNGIPLRAATYKGRLVGSYQGLPLLGVSLACCAPYPRVSVSPPSPASPRPSVLLSCCPNPVPLTLFMTITAMTGSGGGGCGTLFVGQSTGGTYNPTSGQWPFAFPSAGLSCTIYLFCIAGSNVWNLQGAGSNSAPATPDTLACSPFLATFNVLTGQQGAGCTLSCSLGVTISE